MKHNPLQFPEIPEDRIAQLPAIPRDEARLMIVDRKSGTWTHDRFRAVETLLKSGDVLVVNEAKVFPARILGRKTTGGAVRVLLLACLGPEGSGQKWAALLTPSLKEGTLIIFEEGLEARVSGTRPGGEYEIVFGRSVEADIDRLGRMPLPPYIRRKTEPSAELEKLDREYYQTVFARNSGGRTKCIAAPTAGLHFTPELLDAIRAKGVNVISLVLNVGWGTFRPLASEDYKDHKMLPEEYLVSEESARLYNEAKAAGGRIWAVGTTTTRVLEAIVDDRGRISSGTGQTNLYITPGFKFRAVDSLITNFHLPNHTPLLLAAAFGGSDLLRRAYESAVEERYRFFSYGDAMAII